MTFEEFREMVSSVFCCRGVGLRPQYCVEDGGWNRRVLGYLIAVADFLDGEGY